MNEMGSQGGTVSNRKDVTRKNSVMLPNGSGTIIEGTSSTSKATGSSLAAAGSSVIGGVENYKRY